MRQLLRQRSWGRRTRPQSRHSWTVDQLTSASPSKLTPANDLSSSPPGVHSWGDSTSSSASRDHNLTSVERNSSHRLTSHTRLTSYWVELSSPTKDSGGRTSDHSTTQARPASNCHCSASHHSSLFTDPASCSSALSWCDLTRLHEIKCEVCSLHGNERWRH